MVFRSAAGPKSGDDRVDMTAAAVAAICLMISLPCAARTPFGAEFDLHTLRATQGGDGSEGVVFFHDPPCTDCTAVFGLHVSGLGDVTGDGVDDMIVGDPKSLALDDPPAGGAAFAEFGHAPPFPAELGHDDMSFTLRSDVDTEDDGAGVVAHIGDLNGDGFEDIAVAAPALPLMGLKGRIFVLFGRDTGFPDVFHLQDLESGDGSEGVVFEGATVDDHVGYALGGACDFNGDGTDDLLIGAPGSDTVTDHNAGAVGIVFGRPAFPADFLLANLLPENGGDGSEGVVLTGVRELGGVGTAVDCAGDANADGTDDVILTENLGGPIAAGYLVLGHPGPSGPIIALRDLLPGNGGDGSQGTVFVGQDDVLDVAGAGDVNGDGIADLLFGVPAASVGGSDDAGETFVVFGRADGFDADFQLPSLLPGGGGDGSAGFVLEGASVAAASGTSVRGAGDVDGDGHADLMVGAPGVSDDAAGSAFLVFGADEFPATVDLSSLFAANGGDGSVGVVFEGESGAVAGPGNAGRSVAAAGDVDADGFADVLVGAPDQTADGHAGEGGAAYLLFGRARDRDADGIADGEDNCTLVANADQRDTNDDGFGNICDTDIDGDCVTNFVDLGLLKEVFFLEDPDSDFDGDGFINFVDLGIMKAAFFAPPGPSGVASCTPEQARKRASTR
jgi:hypothetical protein